MRCFQIMKVWPCLKKNTAQLSILFGFAVCFFVIDRCIYHVCLNAYRTIPRAETGGMVPEALKSRANVIVLGSSMARHHYVPAILSAGLGSSVYNLGSDGQGIAFMRCAIDILLGHYRPEAFILNISPGTISVQSNTLTMPRVTALSAYLDESVVVREIIYGKGPFEKVKYISRAFRFNDLPVRYIYNGLFPRKDFSGLSGFSPILRILDPQARKEAQEDWVLDRRAVHLLRAAVIQARERGVQVVFVQSPHWCWEATPDYPQYQLIKAAIKLAEEERVPFIRITPQEYPQFKDHRLYADASHLNYEGAKLFSTILAERLSDALLIVNK